MSEEGPRLSAPILGMERVAGEWEGEGSSAREEAELKYRGARFAVNGTFADFPDYERGDGGDNGDRGRGENAPSRRKSFRLDDKAASSNSRKRGDDIVHHFQATSLCSMAKDKNASKRGVLYAATSFPCGFIRRDTRGAF